jgi:rod shape-determining protein MreD
MNRVTSRFATVGKYAITLISIVVVQGILADWFRIFSYFDLALIYCVYYGFTLSRPMASVFIGSILGLLQDSLSGAPMGTNGFSKTLICFLAASTSLKFNVDQGITRIIALFLFTLSDGLLVTMLGLSMGAAVEPLSTGKVLDSLISAVFNTLLGLMMFGLYDRFKHAA